ncbi:MAG TPA: hypothetical protein VF049_05950 [Nocardioidaceae bacterium]|jgi:hypothetical protein
MDSPRDLPGLLRQEVGRFRASQRRRVFDAAVHVGVPAGPHASFVLPARDVAVADDALRIDVVCALLNQVPAGCGYAWLTRPGVPEVHDLDLRWLAAAGVAFGSFGRDLDGFFAVTRAGWLDVRTGERRVWRRLRL